MAYTIKTVKMFFCECTRCKYKWQSKELPIRCARCKSPYWNSPRKHRRSK